MTASTIIIILLYLIIYIHNMLDIYYSDCVGPGAGLGPIKSIGNSSGTYKSSPS